MNEDEAIVRVPFAFAGDWHGDEYWAVAVIKKLASEGIKVIYQLGDFGLWPGPSGKKYLDGVAKACHLYGVKLIVIPGNHDDYNRIAIMRVDDNGWLKLKDAYYKNIFFAPRGHTWIESGYRFASLGGAGSVDRLIRVEGESWWPGEEITQKDCDTLVKNVANRGWDRLDVLLTHEAPAGPILQSMFNGYNRPSWFTIEIEHACWTQRVRMRDAVDIVKPYLNIHGHWHYRSKNVISGVDLNDIDYECNVIGLSNEGSLDNFWVPEVEEFSKLLS